MGTDHRRSADIRGGRAQCPARVVPAARRGWQNAALRGDRLGLLTTIDRHDDTIFGCCRFLQFKVAARIPDLKETLAAAADDREGPKADLINEVIGEQQLDQLPAAMNL